MREKELLNLSDYSLLKALLISFLVLIATYIVSSILVYVAINTYRILRYGPFGKEFGGEIMGKDKTHYCISCGYEISEKKYYDNKGYCDPCLAQKIAEEQYGKKKK